MGFGEILQGLKGKVLDLQHIEMLRHAYDLQEENVKQLKCNNDLLRDSAQRLEAQLQETSQRLREAETSRDSALAELKEMKFEVAAADGVLLDENDCMAMIDEWLQRNGQNWDGDAVIKFVDVDRELKLPAGTAERMLEVAARRLKFYVVRRGTNTIQMGCPTFFY